MKALLLKDKGLWQEMSVGDVERPLPSSGDILVKVHAVGLNPVDYKTATGGNSNWTYPHILGLDVAGIIEEIGEGVTEWKKGDRVVYHGNLAKKGGYAEYAVTTAHTASRIPDEISFEEAAALPCAGYTAYQALFRKLHIQENQTILIHGGAGGVGGFAIQLAKQKGLTVITTASEHNHDYVKELGADFAIDYKQEDVVEKVMKLTNGVGVNAVLDTVSRDNATASLDALTFNGQIAFIAGPPDYTKVKTFTKSLSYHEIALGGAHFSNNRNEQEDLARMGDEMLRLLVDKKLSPLVEEVITLDEVPQALVKLSERHVKGKIVVKMA
ncbi:zinc-binding dehydrogenase [Metabacillus iocasae]|uniref:NADPH:quinone reductase-like Zn-dependent oxidoreductase n=1 Tax=Priestia iocasae TaxID=2291674 RepID=A0ABS2QX72_9BACI|nr:zinc-binding dehydrogenase [Metabacillus iocasae]MBM7703597.1 NADPH:quinone reductase-like Zn-dependent oxidoreductase [Metabacillus iocasae]